jgi:hypothetical protein
MAKDNTPRISVNKLAEYLVSKGGRQRQILRDQKYPTEFKGHYYRESEEAVASCLKDNLENLSYLDRAWQSLNQTQSDKVGTQRRVNSNLDAIESFESMLDKIDLKGATPSLGHHAPEKLKIHNVAVSVRPEIILRGQGKSQKKLIGGIKLHFPRTFSLTEDSAGYVSAVLQEYFKVHFNEEGEVYAPYCFVIDVGSKTVHQGVKSTSARMKDVAAECQNIAALWPSIMPSD